MKLAKESWILIILGSADLATTILWIERGMAEEANPLFHFFWNQGLLAFIAAKYLFLLGPILLREWARWRRPRFARMGLRAGALAYVLLYGAGVARINSAQAEPLAPGLEAPIVFTTASYRPHHRQDRLQDGLGQGSSLTLRHANTAVRHATVTLDSLCWSGR